MLQHASIITGGFVGLSCSGWAWTPAGEEGSMVPCVHFAVLGRTVLCVLLGFEPPTPSPHSRFSQFSQSEATIARARALSHSCFVWSTRMGR